jgi:electron transfer flavoprotein alpha subunit
MVIGLGLIVIAEAEVLASLVREKSPAVVLLAATGQNKEVAGRLAVKTNSGVLADATGLAARDGKIVAEQSVLGGATVVHSAVRQARRSSRCCRTRSPPSRRPRRRSSAMSR